MLFCGCDATNTAVGGYSKTRRLSDSERAMFTSVTASIEGVESAKINFLTEKLTVETTLAESEAYDALSKAAKAFSRDIVIEK